MRFTARLQEVLIRKLDLSKTELRFITKKYKTNLLQHQIISTIQYLHYIDRVNEPGTIFEFVGLFSILEAFSSRKKREKRDKIHSFLMKNLLAEEKIELLMAFTFSKKYIFRKKIKDRTLRHIMYKEMVKDKKFRLRWHVTDDQIKLCYASCWYCKHWIERHPRKIKVMLKQLVDYLYSIRNGIVPKAIVALPMTESGSVFDAFPLNSKKQAYFISYSGDITIQRFRQIILGSVKRELLA